MGELLYTIAIFACGALTGFGIRGIIGFQKQINELNRLKADGEHTKRETMESYESLRSTYQHNLEMIAKLPAPELLARSLSDLPAWKHIGRKV